MGADAEIFVFDHERYRAEVVPALLELLRGGEPAPWLGDLIDAAPQLPSGAALVSELRRRPADFARHCTWLGADLRYVGGDQVDRSTGKQLTCRSLTCPERLFCRFHTAGDRHAVEDLNALHELTVAVRCLGASQFLGRTITADYYRPVLAAQGVSAADPLWGLLAALATRGAALGYQFGVTEGIHGWLTVAETAELAAGLDRLELPRNEPTFAAMECRREDAARPWAVTSLSFVRTVATIAAGRDRAVLWGNDVAAGPDLRREID